MANSVDPDETAHYEPSHQDLYCLHSYLVLVCRTEREAWTVLQITLLFMKRLNKTESAIFDFFSVFFAVN